MENVIGRYLGKDVYEYRNMEDYIADFRNKAGTAYGLVDNRKLCLGEYIVAEVSWDHGDNDVRKLKTPVKIPMLREEPIISTFVPVEKEKEKEKEKEVDIKLPSIEDIIKEIRGLEMITVEEKNIFL